MELLIVKMEKLSSSIKWKLMKWENKRKTLCILISHTCPVSNIKTQNSWKMLSKILTNLSLILGRDLPNLCSKVKFKTIPWKRHTFKLLSTTYHKWTKSENWEHFLWVDSCLSMVLSLEPLMPSLSSFWEISNAWNAQNTLKIRSSNSNILNLSYVLIQSAVTRLDGSWSVKIQLWLIGKRLDFKSTLVIFLLDLCLDQSILFSEVKLLIFQSLETRQFSLVNW